MTNTTNEKGALRSRRLLAATFAALALAAAGCGGDDEEPSEDTGTSGATGAAAATVSNDVEVSMTEYAMAPSNVLPDDGEGGPPTSVAQPGEVNFTVTNDGEEPHEFVFNNLGKEIPIDGEIAPGETAELTVDVGSGFFEYYCPIAGHQEQGMQGQLQVE